MTHGDLVLLATDGDHPGLDPDDADLPAALAGIGLRAQPAVWDDPAVDWGRASLVVVRSTWDYIDRLAAYRAWWQRVGAVTSLANDPATLAWNAHKGYLLDLAGCGVDVVPTVLLPARRPADLATLLADRGWPRAVVKPAVSSGARNTVVVMAATAAAHQAWLDGLLAGRDVLVQPYVADVDRHGETSLVFLGGHLSHAVARPAALAAGHAAAVAGTRPVVPTGAEVDLARSALAAARALRPAAAPLLYARVDVLRRDAGPPLLLELEVTEPRLFLTWSPGAPDRFAAAVRDHLAGLPTAGR